MIMEKYYYMIPDCLNKYIETQKIRNYLLSYTILHETSEGRFICENPFIDISLMNIKNLNSWSSNNFDCYITNYISIIINELDKNNIIIKFLFQNLENFCKWSIFEDLE